MPFVVKNNLNSFIDKITTKADVRKLSQNAISLIAENGENIAKEQYAGTNITVSSDTRKNGVSINASGQDVLYMEFGTGRVGEHSGYPHDKLPKQGIPITGSWQYYYPSKYKRTSKTTGDEGWFHRFSGEKKAQFIVGQVSGKQMFYTSQQLREYIKHNLVRDLRSKQ